MSGRSGEKFPLQVCECECVSLCVCDERVCHRVGLWVIVCAGECMQSECACVIVGECVRVSVCLQCEYGGCSCVCICGHVCECVCCHHVCLWVSLNGCVCAGVTLLCGSRYLWSVCVGGWLCENVWEQGFTLNHPHLGFVPCAPRGFLGVVGWDREMGLFRGQIKSPSQGLLTSDSGRSCFALSMLLFTFACIPEGTLPTGCVPAAC